MAIESGPSPLYSTEDTPEGALPREVTLRAKRTLGLFTLIPAILALTRVVAALSPISRSPDARGHWLAIGLCIVLLHFTLLIYYAYDAINNRRLDTTGKAFWLVALVLAGPVSMPMYWYYQIWNPPAR